MGFENLEANVPSKSSQSPILFERTVLIRNSSPSPQPFETGDGAVLMQTTDGLFETLHYNFEVGARNSLRFIQKMSIYQYGFLQSCLLRQDFLFL
jgi:hypothetical protein